tara:strand:+ start:513 stop:992 length:480 start_codon:yes stop_codon:yes gene_type:complete
MTQNIKIFTYLLIFLFFTNCGFKVLDKSRFAEFTIKNVELTGNNKINFYIKSKLKNNFSSSSSQKEIYLRINSKKTKTIKEKNIKNEITKYRIQVIVDVEVNVDNFNVTKRFNLSRNGDYNVANEQSRTISNQNNLEKYLANTIAEDVSDKIIFILNDI